jgi:hypothetical protein
VILRPAAWTRMKQSTGSELSVALRACRGAFLGLALMSGMLNVLYLTGSFFMLEIYDRVIPSRSIPTLIGLAAIAVLLYASAAVSWCVSAAPSTRRLQTGSTVSSRACRSRPAASAMASSPCATSTKSDPLCQGQERELSSTSRGCRSIWPSAFSSTHTLGLRSRPQPRRGLREHLGEASGPIEIQHRPANPMDREATSLCGSFQGNRQLAGPSRDQDRRCHVRAPANRHNPPSAASRDPFRTG